MAIPIYKFSISTMNSIFISQLTAHRPCSSTLDGAAGLGSPTTYHQLLVTAFDLDLRLVCQYPVPLQRECNFSCVTTRVVHIKGLFYLSTPKYYRCIYGYHHGLYSFCHTLCSLYYPPAQYRWAGFPALSQASYFPISYKYYTEFYEACQGFSFAKPHIFID